MSGTCAACGATTVIESFAFVCICELKQGICDICNAARPLDDRIRFVYDRLGHDHNIHERIAHNGRPMFRSLFQLGLRNGPIPGMPPNVRAALIRMRQEASLGVSLKCARLVAIVFLALTAGGLLTLLTLLYEVYF